LWLWSDKQILSLFNEFHICLNLIEVGTGMADEFESRPASRSGYNTELLGLFIGSSGKFFLRMGEGLAVTSGRFADLDAVIAFAVRYRDADDRLDFALPAAWVALVYPAAVEVARNGTALNKLAAIYTISHSNIPN
jgi:hypothetical protein